MFWGNHGLSLGRMKSVRSMFEERAFAVALLSTLETFGLYVVLVRERCHLAALAEVACQSLTYTVQI